ncbi:serine/threonine-protein kinase [Modestobacter sp. DSM 44400]|uniref:serine/threonine-protein kinase n=1 Tax=Modestobacter sp. DSM 44400 TaxID=1550230 RepID=UPI000B89A559|nr:serine/threonine-protein kinase [Modestobacter sp. DSM 44400]
MPVDPVVRPFPVVPGYVLEELLGRGGSGEVWRARPRGGGAPVAVKVLVRGDPERQVREAAMLSELNHPHLVRLHRVVRREVRGGGTEVALVLDLLAGGSLASLLARRGRLRPGEVVTTVAPVAAALAQAHGRGVVHGDLSPGNVVFTAEGRPVLTDLGTARVVGEVGRAEVTPAYVDPVVARGGAPGPASDVFGVAAAAFHALTGIAPWNAADPAGTLAVASRGEVPDLALLAPDAPADLVRVVERGLSLEPHLRGSAAAFALDLRHACRPEPVRLPAPGVPDEVLGLTGRGPRTELTHQVGGRRPGAAHAAPVVPSRLAGARRALTRVRGGTAAEPVPVRERLGPVLRRCAVTLTAVVAVAGALVGAAWLGAGWGGGRIDPVPAAEMAGVERQAPGPAASGSTTTAEPVRSTAAPSPAAPSPSGTPTSVSELGTGDLDGWAALLGQLYARRSGAYTAGDAAALSEVYSVDSALLRRDAEQVSALAAAGETVMGFAPAVRQVTAVTGDDRSVVVDLVDEVPGYRLVPARDPGRAAREVAGRGPAEVRMTLHHIDRGWRIVDATRRS